MFNPPYVNNFENFTNWVEVAKVCVRGGGGGGVHTMDYTFTCIVLVPCS